MSRPVDLWDVGTYPDNVLAVLRDREELLLNFYAEEKRLDELDQDTPEAIIRNNKYFDEFERFLAEQLEPELDPVAVRVWHYSRLLEHEKVELRHSGMTPASLDFLEKRLLALRKEELLNEADCSEVFKSSALDPTNGPGRRVGMIWFTTYPFHPAEGGVIPFLNSWGGEGVYWNLKTSQIDQKLKSIGSPCILEVALPFVQFSNPFAVAEYVVERFTGHFRKFGPISPDTYSKLTVEASSIVEFYSPENFDMMSKKAMNK